MRCVSYTRFVSSLTEKEVPPDIIRLQNERIERFAKGNGWTISQKYSDRKNDKKAETAFLQMKQDAMNRQFDMVITDSFYRFGKSIAVARNAASSLFFPAGIHFAVAEDEFCSAGKSQQDVDQYIAEKYAEYRTKTRWSALMAKREEGFFNVHDERYGYLLSDDRRQLVIDEEAAKVIREAYTMMAEGMDMRSIADALNRKGYDPPARHLEKVSKKRRFTGRALVWTANSVKTITGCRQYLGRTVKKVNDKYVEYEIPAIIDQGLFDKAAETRKRNFHSSPKERPQPNALRFLIRDRASGQSMICISYGKYRNDRRFCIGRRNKDESISYDRVLAEVTDLLKREIRQAANAAAMIDSEEGRAVYDERRMQITADMQRLVRKISDASEERIRSERADGDDDRHFLSEDNDRCLMVLEDAFQENLQQLRKLDTAFKDNPWIRLYRDIELSEELKNADARKWIEAVWVRDFKYVTADMKEQDWKQMLPAQWRKEGGTYGEEEQKDIRK